MQYQIDKPVESSYQSGCDTNWRVGSQLSNVKGECFMFSGTVIDERTGITVAHAVNEGEEVMTFRPENGEEVRRVIGQCYKAVQDVQIITDRSEFTMTADIAALDLLPQFRLRRNLVQGPENGKEFKVKIYKGPRISMTTEVPVMIIDQTGQFQYGFIRKERLIDTTLERRGKRNLFNVMEIEREAGDAMPESACTTPGDSGALVLSMPSENSDVLYVYGIVTGLYTRAGTENSLTIANCLGEVIPEVFKDQPTDTIDFTAIVDHNSDSQ